MFLSDISKTKHNNQFFPRTFFVDLTFLYKKDPHENSSNWRHFQDICIKLQCKMSLPRFPTLLSFFFHLVNARRMRSPVVSRIVDVKTHTGDIKSLIFWGVGQWPASGDTKKRRILFYFTLSGRISVMSRHNDAYLCEN